MAADRAAKGVNPMLKLALACTLVAVPCLTLAAEALRLDDGRAFVCAYYFGHWWDPWKSSDDAIRADFRRLAGMGVSVLGVDHEWSQAIDGDWKWLDREHRLAKEAGLRLLPWLSAKCWSDMGVADRPKLVKDWFGVDLRFGTKQDGSPGAVQIWDDATIRAGAAYAAMYLDRYRDGALLHVSWKGRSRPVVALSCELGWDGGGFDEATTMLFIRWLRGLYGDDIARLNAAWGAAYAGFWDVNPCDTDVFGYAHLQAGEAKHPQAVEDHIEFRSQLISDSLGMVAARLRRTHPDVLILAEVPYQFRFDHPHAEGYRIGYACNPSCVRSADIVFCRCGSLLSQESADFTEEWSRKTGQPAILTYRTYSDWCNERPAEEVARLAELYATSSARYGSGFGFYSWNEMVDTHVAPSPPDAMEKPGALTPEQSERGFALMAAMVKRYLEIVGGKPAGGGN
jgi:hypothetical protein